MGKRRVQREDHAVYKNNFWNQIRKERGVSFKYIGDILGRSATMVRYYFMGKQMPPPEHIKLMCEGFNVDLEQGTAEFKKMHKTWRESHGKATVKPKVDSFLKQKVKDAKISYKELSEIVNVPYSTLKAYFSGFALPNTDKITNICNLLDIDPAEGEAEFIRLNTAWGTTHPDYEKYGNTYRRIADKRGTKKKATSPVEHNADDYLELLYGKVSCAEFRAISSMNFNNAEELLRIIYNKVDFDTFMFVMRNFNI